MDATNSKVLLVTKAFPKKAPGGRELLNKLLYSILVGIFSKNLILHPLPREKAGIKDKFFGFFSGFVDGLNKNRVNDLLKIISSEKIEIVFTDGSNLGAFVKIAKKAYPHIRFITFFHNVEYLFFAGLFKKHKTLKSLMLLMLIYRIEKKAVNFSDNIICLNKRDSKDLEQLYGSGSDAIFPMALRDTYQNSNKHFSQDEYILFVGGLFYANEFGIKWFIKNVVPKIKRKLLIVGMGFEKLKDELEMQGKIEVVGSVDNISEYYSNAKFVIAPIFDGSGMKTKTAESMMHGKKIIGTKEAFMGYEDHITEAGWVCNSPEEFIRAIDQAENEIKISFDKNLRNIYENNYSLESASKIMKKIINN